jgi:hypothetical protein
MSERIRIFVGVSPNNEDLESQSVLEFALRKHHPADDLDIEWMQLSRDPDSFWYSEPAKGLGWNPGGWATPFSAFRWAIPAACGYKGKAIYLDSDMIPMADIAGLWNQKFKNPYAAVISKAASERFCVSLFDCARMKKYAPSIADLRRDPNAFRRIRARMKGTRVQRFQGNWNCIDDELCNYPSLDHPEIKMIHYTAIPTQVHLKHSLPRLIAEGGRHWYTGRPQEHPRQDLQDLFDRLLIEATENGYGIERYRKEPFGDYRIRWAA